MANLRTKLTRDEVFEKILDLVEEYEDGTITEPIEVTNQLEVLVRTWDGE